MMLGEDEGTTATNGSHIRLLHGRGLLHLPCAVDRYAAAAIGGILLIFVHSHSFLRPPSPLHLNDKDGDLIGDDVRVADAEDLLLQDDATQFLVLAVVFKVIVLVTVVNHCAAELAKTRPSNLLLAVATVCIAPAPSPPAATFLMLSSILVEVLVPVKPVEVRVELLHATGPWRGLNEPTHGEVKVAAEDAR